MALLIRFVVHSRHWRSGVRSGLFQAADEVRESPDHYLKPAIEELLSWFNANVEVPFRDDDKQNEPSWKVDPATRAIAWTKASAVEHVSKLRQLRALIEESGWLVDELTTTRPGAVVYEDEHQVVAIPFAETPT